MSTIDYIRSKEQNDAQPPLDGKGLRIALAVADWNSHITYALRDGAIDRLKALGTTHIELMRVPGAFELTNAAARLKQKGYYSVKSDRVRSYDAIIVIGCVVRGDTPHFDYVCQGVTEGITSLNQQADEHGHITPVIFCVLTTDTMEQAQARAGGSLGNKGEEAADAAIVMSLARLSTKQV